MISPPECPGRQRPVLMRVASLALPLAILGLFFVIWACRMGHLLNPAYFAVYNDDGTYMQMARNLWSGHGYAEAGQVPRFPIGYPLLLSLLWGVSESLHGFVARAVLLNVGLAAGAALMMAWYWRRHVQATWGLTLAAVMLFLWQPLVVNLTQAVLSEMAFLVVVLAIVLVVGHLATHSHDRPDGFLIVGILLGGGMLIRYAGVALVVAFVVWGGLERRWKSLLAAGFGFLIVWGPWMWFRQSLPGEAYSAAFSDSFGLRGLPGGPFRAFALSSYLAFGQALPSFFWERWAHVLPSSWEGRVLTMAGLACGSLIALGLLQTTRACVRRDLPSGVRLASLFVLFTVAMDVVWSLGFGDLGGWQHARLLFPILPFLLHVLIGVDQRLHRAQEIRTAVLVGVLACLAAYPVLTASRPVEVVEDRSEALQQSLAAISLLTGPDAVIVSDLPPLIDLVTGRKTLMWSPVPAANLASLVRYRDTWLLVDCLTPDIDWDTLKARNPRTQFLLSVSKQLPGVLEIAYRNPASGMALYRVNRKRFFSLLRQPPIHRSQAHVSS
jgi:hypothetical protein